MKIREFSLPSWMECAEIVRVLPEGEKVWSDDGGAGRDRPGGLHGAAVGSGDGPGPGRGLVEGRVSVTP